MRDHRHRPVIETRTTREGPRISTIRRADGSTLTVTVPPSAMDDESTGDDGTGSWLHDDGRRRPPPGSALERLAWLVLPGGLHGTAPRWGTALATPF